ncbi:MULTISPECIES: DUF4926 domain-containing protein [unclassified Mycobacteroides]|nr:MULTISPECIES: DUF4926 domain-containing protein [unclassified Mycobacteroides]
MVLDHFSEPSAYEVEFLDADGFTIALLTILATNLEVIGQGGSSR